MTMRVLFLQSAILPHSYILRRNVNPLIIVTELGNVRFTLEDKIYGIDEAFSAATVEDIIDRLEKKGDKFSKDTLALLANMSPMSLKITCEQIQRTAKLNVFEALNQDFRLAWKVLADNDFYEGLCILCFMR